MTTLQTQTTLICYKNLGAGVMPSSLCSCSKSCCHRFSQCTASRKLALLPISTAHGITFSYCSRCFAPNLSGPKTAPPTHIGSPSWRASTHFTATSPTMVVGMPRMQWVKSCVSRYRVMTYARSGQSTKLTSARESGVISCLVRNAWYRKPRVFGGNAARSVRIEEVILGLVSSRAGWFGVGSQKVTAFGKLWAVTVIWPLGYMDIPWLNPLYCRLLNICVEPQIRAFLT